MDMRIHPTANLRDARESRHYSQQELADELGVSRRTVQNWEAGIVPQPRHRRRLVEFLTAAPAEEAVA